MFRKKGSLFAVLAVLMVSALPATAENLADPMRPPAIGSVSASADDDAPRWEVTAILVSDGRRLAMVNNRLLGVGGKVDGARVKAIYGNAVELDIGDRALVIRPAVPSVRK